MGVQVLPKAIFSLDVKQQEEHSVCQILEPADGVKNRNLGTTHTNYRGGGLWRGAGFWSGQGAASHASGLPDSVFFCWVHSHQTSLFCPPLQTMQCVIYNMSNTTQENMPATNLMIQGYTPFGCPRSQRTRKERECKENRSRKGRPRGKGKAAHFLPPSPTH